jgi:ferrous iron transport protein B
VKRIALIGNPNCGKSTLFNRLTGLSQKTSNLPGTTVESSSGVVKLKSGNIELIDLPGIYSLFAQSEDERLVVSTVLGIDVAKPDAIVFIIDGSNIRRNLLLVSQVAELGISSSCILTMADTAKRRSIDIDVKALEIELGIPVTVINPRSDKNIQNALMSLENQSVGNIISHNENFESRLRSFYEGNKERGLSEETLKRYTDIEKIVKKVVIGSQIRNRNNTIKIDKYITHPIFGVVIFFFVMMALFQGVFALSSGPMDLIETAFGWVKVQIDEFLPNGMWADFVRDGILGGISGVIVFVPQIFILFFLIGILEDSGYMVRASFITDRIMRKIGLNGRSIIPLVGGFACAIPSIMATRTIKNKSERLITMLVVPLMSCSARLPVYFLLISLAIPAATFWGPFHAQTFVMTSAYFAGIIVALAFALIFKFIGKDKEKSEFILELPTYQNPRIQTVISQAWIKCRTFLSEAGKVIIIISMILWALSSFGPKEAMKNAQLKAVELTKINKKDSAQIHNNQKLEASYAGHLGKFIEPAIQPLGYDWKTGIALISSFAAREVFVGTMSTLFQTPEDDDQVKGIRTKMQAEINPTTGKPLYGVPYAISLIFFYAFALQCISTMAVIKKETGSWKWPVALFFIYGGIAYISAYTAFKVLSHYF